jgi:hypothetical protein
VRSGAVLSALEGAVQQSEQAMAWTLIEGNRSQVIQDESGSREGTFNPFK